MSVRPGTSLAGYAVERLLGRGGMGEVYLATDGSLGRRVALKLLAPELAADPRFRERFIAESRLAASLDHPHIVPIYEAGEADGRLFLAMRYVEGADLGELLARDGRLDPERTVSLLRGIGAALDAAHERGLVHRDVKPGNMLVARTSRGEEHAYLADFGLVKQLGADATRTGQLVGSVDYVAPEQIEGRPIDGRADVYSLACVLYTCLSGSPPYPRETEMATLWAHVQAEPPRPSATDPALAAFDPVVAAGMAKDPADRLPSAGELMGAAGEALAGKSVGGAREAVRPAVAAPQPSHPAGNLPLQLSSFVGRSAEVADLSRLLPTTRLVTLTGPGGTGKTRLSLEAASAVGASFLDGVHLVELASFRDPALVPAQLAAVLDVAEAGGESIEESIARFLEPKQLLLVLDNLEQLSGLAPLVSRLLARCPGLHILATSRVALHVSGEVEYAVAPLGLPEGGVTRTAEAIAQSDAVMLFAARAMAIRADFRLTDANASAIADIAIGVDGLPLAIELAAARVKVLSPSQILSRLNDRLGLLAGGAADLPERQRTLRATIGWSHELLDEPARVLFRRLALFDGLTFAAAEWIGEFPGHDRPAIDVLEAMTALVDGSLVRPIATDDAEPRFEMLETIREYAREQLKASGEADAVARRHFDFFLELGRRFNDELGVADLGPWLKRLDAERANVDAAIEWAIAAGECRRAADLVEFLIDYTRARRGLTATRSLIARLLAQPEVPEAQRGRLLHEAAVLAFRHGDIEDANKLAAEMLAIARRLDDFHNAVGAGHLLALVAAERGDTVAEERYIGDMLADAERSGEPRMEILAKSHVALRSLRLAEFDRAAHYYDEILTSMRKVGVMSESLSSALFNKGVAELHAGHLGKAAESLAASAEIGESMEHAEQLGYALEGYAALAAVAGRHALAATLQGASTAALEEAESTLEAFEAEMSARTAAAAKAALGDAGYDRERASGASMPIGEALGAARAIGDELLAAEPAERAH